MSVSASSPSGQDGSKKSDASPNPGLIRPNLLDAGMTCADAPAAASQARGLPSLQIPPRKELPFECDSDFPRSTSATSSLDPYYFSVPSQNDSPVPPLPDGNGEPESRLFRDPVTPARDPASIDRNGLFGVGELLTPRWPNAFPPFRNEDDLTLALAGDSEDGKPLAEDVKDASDDDDRDSPWTIEAVDGEPEQFEDTMDDASEREWKTRTHRSMADESGGEEILYPRKTLLIEISKEARPVLPGHEGSRAVRESPSPSVPTSPPSSFLSPTRKAKKRSSDEFAFDQSGFLIPKVSANDANSSLQNHGKDEKQALRKHHSLALSSTTAAALPREKKRGGSVRMSIGSVTKSGLTQPRSSKHARQQSAGSTSSTPGDLGRRGPETNSISSSPSAASSQPRRVAGPSVRLSSEKLSLLREKDLHSSPSVAHSLLRGTQEGWSALDDDATAEALRKLDGISGKGARTRGSVGPASRLSNHSRPGTPGASRGHRSEGAEGSDRLSRRISSTGTHGRVKDRIRPDSTVISDKEIRVYGLDQSSQPDTGSKSLTTVEGSPLIKSSDGQLAATIMLESDSKKSGSSARLSFTAKRSSASSTNYTGTPTSSSRDSAILSATSVTSASVTSSRFSLVKARRNSAGSDISSVHSGEATSQRDRVASLLTGEVTDGDPVPPVPPLPKDLSSYRTPPQSSASLVFPASDSISDNGKEVDREASDRAASLEAPRIDHSLGLPTSSNIQVHEMPDKSVAPTILKTPSKKWSFTNPLSLRRSASPNRRDPSVLKSSSGLAPHSAMSKKQDNSSSSKDSPLLPTISPKSSVEAWQSIQRGAMASETSLASLSSLSSLLAPSPPISPSQPFGGMPTTRSHERDMPSRAGTTSSVSTNHAFLEIRPGQKSPSPSAHRESNNKRLTPSSIPFFRRSSSQSMQIPPSSATTAMSMSPTFSSAPNIQHTPGPRTDISPQKDSLVMSPSTPGSSQRKSSMLSLGLPSLLKGSSSRKSLQVEKGGANGKKHKESDNESTKNKKDDKDRSESRISVLMGRKRGKTLSSTDQKKIKPIALPPMQIAAIPPATAERLAQVGSTVSSSSSSPSRNPTSTSSRATSQTISSMQKQSDASLRSSRQQLPTIAGSPSVGVHGINSHRSQSREQKEHHSSAYASAISSVTKETPTRIPRIASRSSTVTSPQLKGSSSLLASRRTSLNLGTLGPQSESSVVGADESMNEFGVLDYMEETISKSQNPSTTYRQSFRSSPSSSTKDVRHPLGLSAAISSSGGIPRKAAHDPVSVKGLRKLSTGSVASMASAAGLDQNHVSTLSPSKGSPSKGLNKLLSPKMTLPGSRLSSSSTAPNIFHHQTSGSPTSRCQPLSTPSPIPSSVDEDELLGDEEMMQYIKRTQARKLAHGAKKEELDELLKFPEPLPPGRPSSPATILSNERSPHLSDYERKEILDYPFVYYFGNKNDKKLASRDVSTNNYGYDDDRGDYQVINHDHLAYRYEIIDTLGKGSFGQVLHCRDHCSGESVAIKIIRNKKRFHHQALVEIKILENLRKWDPEEKHFVIKMTEHFYFRNHLCIAMELLSINLYELIKANGFAGFSTTLIRRFTSQMLLSLSLMRHHRIVHCDLKPENVLLRHPAKSGIKVIDFGSSCLEHEKVYTYIQSRFYRSPEVILGLNYNMAIDMWSLGCILAELYTGYPIFPGENEQEQLSCIMEVLGVPDKDLVNRSSRKRLFFDSTGAPRPVVNSKGRRRRAGTKTLAQVLRCDDELFVDFVSKCLAWDPERRIKPQSAMRHPFVTAGRRAKIVNNTTPSSSRGHLSSSSLLNVGRNKPTETPKKSQIGAPTPLAARSARAPTTQIPSTPIGSLAHPAQGSSKSFRTSQAPYHSSRSMNGFAIATAK